MCEKISLLNFVQCASPFFNCT